MNVLHIVQRMDHRVLSAEGIFLHPVNRYREIQVDNPNDVFGEPIYTGPAYLAAKYLEPGAYWYVWADDDVYSD